MQKGYGSIKAAQQAFKQSVFFVMNGIEEEKNVEKFEYKK